MAQQGSSVINEIRVRVIAEGGYQILDQYGRRIGEYNKATAEATERTKEWGRAATSQGQAIRDMGEAFAKGTIGMKSAASGLDEFGDIAFKFNNIISQVQPVMELLGSRMKAAFDAGVEWQKGMANVGTVIDIVGTSAEKAAASVGQLQAAAAAYGEAIKPILLNSNVPTEDALRGAYDVLSAGFTDSTDAIKIFDSAVKLAVTTLGTVPEAVDTITSVLNAYKMGADDATSVTNAFVVAAQYGKLTLDELNIGIGKVIPVAAQLGVPLAEIAAGIATITQSGVPAAEAETNMRMAMVSLLKPTKEMVKLIQSLGYETGQEMIAAEGLKNTLEKLSQATLGSESSFALAFSRVQGLNAATILGSLNSQRYGEILQATTDAMVTAGLQSSQLEKRFGVQMNTTASLWEVTKKFFEELKRQQFKEFESALKKVLNGLIYVMDSIRQMSESNNPFDRIIKSTGTWAIGIGALLAAITVAIVNILSKFYLARVAVVDMAKSWTGFVNKAASTDRIKTLDDLINFSSSGKQAAAVAKVGTAEEEVLATEQKRYSLAGQMNELLLEQQRIMAATKERHAATDKSESFANAETKYLRSIGVKPGDDAARIDELKSIATKKRIAADRAAQLDRFLPARSAATLFDEMSVDLKKGKPIDKIKRIAGAAQAKLTEALLEMTSEATNPKNLKNAPKSQQDMGRILQMLEQRREEILTKYAVMSKSSDKAALDKAGIVSVERAQQVARQMASEIADIQKQYRAVMQRVLSSMKVQHTQQNAGKDFSVFVKNSSATQADDLELSAAARAAHARAAVGDIVSPNGTRSDIRAAEIMRDAGRVELTARAMKTLELNTKKTAEAYKLMGSIVVRSLATATTASIIFSDSLQKMGEGEGASAAAARWIQKWGLGLSFAVSTLGPEIIGGVMGRFSDIFKAYALMNKSGVNASAIAKMWISGVQMKHVQAILTEHGAEVINAVGAAWQFQIFAMLKRLGVAILAHPWVAAGVAIAAGMGLMWRHVSKGFDAGIDEIHKRADAFNEAVAKSFTADDATRTKIVNDYGEFLHGTVIEMAAKADSQTKADVATALGKQKSEKRGLAARVTDQVIEDLFGDGPSFIEQARRRIEESRKNDARVPRNYFTDPQNDGLIQRAKRESEKEEKMLEFMMIDARVRAIQILERQKKLNQEEAQAAQTAAIVPAIVSEMMIATERADREFTQWEQSFVAVAKQAGVMMRGGLNKILEATRQAGKVSPEDIQGIRDESERLMLELEKTVDPEMAGTLLERLLTTLTPALKDISEADKTLYYAIANMVTKLVDTTFTTFDNRTQEEVRPRAVETARAMGASIRDGLELAVSGIVASIEAVKGAERIEQAITDMMNADPTAGTKTLLKSALREQEASLEQALADYASGDAASAARARTFARRAGQSMIAIAKEEMTTAKSNMAIIDKELQDLQNRPFVGKSGEPLTNQAKARETMLRNAEFARLQAAREAAAAKLESARYNAGLTPEKTTLYLETDKKIKDSLKKGDGINAEISNAAKRTYDAAKGYGNAAAKIKEAFENNVKSGDYAAAAGLVEEYLKWRRAEVDYLIKGSEIELDAVNKAIAAGGGKDLQGLIADRAALEAEISAMQRLKEVGDFDSAEMRTKLLTVEQGVASRKLMDVASSFDAVSSAMAEYGDTTGAAAQTTAALNARIEALALDAVGIQAALDQARKTGTAEDVELQLARAEENAAKARAFAEKIKTTQDANDGLVELVGKKFVSATQQSGDMMNQFADVGANAIGTFSDAIVDFANGAKVSFSEMARSILADLAKIALRMAIMKVVGIALDGLGGGGVASAAAGSASSSLSGTSLSWNQGAYNTGRFDTGGYVGSGGRKVQVTAHEGEAIFTPRQMENADKLFGSLAAYRGGGEPKITINNYGDSQVSTKTGRGPQGELEIEVIVQQLEGKMMSRMDRGAGLAPYLENQYGASRTPGRSL